MPSDLSSYLAQNYLVADPKPTKKRKRKQAAEGLIIADDDDASWAKPQASANDDVDGPATVDGSSAEFRRTKKSNWKSITGAPTSQPANADADAAAADAILASAAAETLAAQHDDDALPTFDDAGVAKMSDGTHAGLQSAATVSAQLRRRQAAEQAEFARMKAGGREEETVYRDATGRRVDVSMRRAEARRAAAEAEEREKERQAKIAPKGDVQAAAANARREALEEAKTMAFARGADDEDMNREMKGKERWNDPMAQFMQTDTATTTTGGKGKKGKNRPVYTGGAQPNRYGIRPGYRWDGVDRSNGFEGERFKAINRRERNKGLDYSWQMDDSLCCVLVPTVFAE
ncbi:Pre-mRNA-splicing factor CWC26 like protein [Verticillium longisporum]|nr:Pre-mRNA-splicing factor CWC26 like protein [Verticillium longisporum]